LHGNLVFGSGLVARSSFPGMQGLHAVWVAGGCVDYCRESAAGFGAGGSAKGETHCGICQVGGGAQSWLLQVVDKVLEGWQARGEHNVYRS